ncbi:MAG: CRISPR-associated protein Cas4 [Chloroflexota bacterium]|nr:CRISPR-associated protein Cas4 [Chloroflexota bacterium]
MLDDDLKYPIRVTDLKQWAYCPRVFYFQHCLPDVRPTTFKMRAGVQAGRSEAGREERRSLRAYGIAAGEREFDVLLRSARLGLRGEVDMVITVGETGEVIPVDYKLARLAGAHFQLQVAVYGMLIEEMRGVTVTRGFLYEIPLRRAEEIKIDARARKKAEQAVAAMRYIAESETMPAAARNRAKCVACEFRRFCNDVL